MRNFLRGGVGLHRISAAQCAGAVCAVQFHWGQKCVLASFAESSHQCQILTRLWSKGLALLKIGRFLESKVSAEKGCQGGAEPPWAIFNKRLLWKHTRALRSLCSQGEATAGCSSQAGARICRRCTCPNAPSTQSQNLRSAGIKFPCSSRGSW